MTEFTVTWSIDVDADNARQAAEAALEIMLNPSFDSAVFRVYEADSFPGHPVAGISMLVKVPYPDGFVADEGGRDTPSPENAWGG